MLLSNLNCYLYRGLCLIFNYIFNYIPEAALNEADFVWYTFTIKAAERWGEGDLEKNLDSNEWIKFAVC